MADGQTEFRLVFGSGVNLSDANNLKSRIATILERADFGRLVLLFSSEGGSTDQSLALSNFLSSLPVSLHIHAIGHVGSAGIPVFLAGHKRTCEPLSRFFFHEYDWSFDGRQTLRRIDEAAQRLRSDIDLARQIIKRETQAGADILQAIDGASAPIVLDPQTAKTLGFVEEVCSLPKANSDGMPIAVWTA